MPADSGQDMRPVCDTQGRTLLRTGKGGKQSPQLENLSCEEEKEGWPYTREKYHKLKHEVIPEDMWYCNGCGYCWNRDEFMIVRFFNAPSNGKQRKACFHCSGENRQNA